MNPSDKSARAWVGTSGWSYQNWAGDFYPEDLPPRQYLQFYAKHFPAAEVNYSFYHLPRVTTYEHWRQQVPQHFIFALKCSRLITHTRRLDGVEDAWKQFLSNAQVLGPQLGPILFQFPSTFAMDCRRLSRFLSLVRASANTSLRTAFEFRHASWFVDAVYNLLADHQAALCIADSPEYPRHDVITTDFIYYRFHGRTCMFASNYTPKELSLEATKMKEQLKEGADIYAFFNNDAEGHAVPNARRLMQLVA